MCHTALNGVLVLSSYKGQQKNVKSRQVSDLKKVNPRLVRVGNPLDGSSHILRRLEPDEVSFRAIDLSSGYD